jgi:hypothetical protein
VGGTGETVAFTLAFDKAGTKTIEINGLVESMVVNGVEEEPEREGAIS